MLVGYLNAEESEPYLSQFLYDYNAKNIFKQNTCFKKALNPSFIEEFSTFFEYAVSLLNVKPCKYYISDMENLSGPVEITIRKFENHPSVQAIKQNISVNQDFLFL